MNIFTNISGCKYFSIFVLLMGSYIALCIHYLCLNYSSFSNFTNISHVPIMCDDLEHS